MNRICFNLDTIKSAIFYSRHFSSYSKRQKKNKHPCIQIIKSRRTKAFCALLMDIKIEGDRTIKSKGLIKKYTNLFVFWLNKKSIIVLIFCVYLSAWSENVNNTNKL